MLMVLVAITGLPGGKQGLFEQDNFTSPAYVARLDYKGVPGLRAGVAFYYCNDVTANADKNYKYSSVGRSSVKNLLCRCTV